MYNNIRIVNPYPCGKQLYQKRVKSFFMVPFVFDPGVSSQNIIFQGYIDQRVFSPLPSVKLCHTFAIQLDYVIILHSILVFFVLLVDFLKILYIKMHLWVCLWRSHGFDKYILKFSSDFFFTIFVRFLLKVFILFVAIVNEGFSIIVSSNWLLFVYIKATDFSMLILYPSTSLNTFHVRVNFTINSLEFARYKIISSKNRDIFIFF